MQGQRSIYDPFPEAVDLNQVSVSNNNGMDQSSTWQNTITPAERRLLEIDFHSGEGNFNCLNPLGQNAHGLSGWDVGESSSNGNLHDHMANDRIKMDESWSSPFTAHSGPDSTLGDRQFEILRDGFSSGVGGNQVAGTPLNIQNSGVNHIPNNANLNTRYGGNSDDGGHGMEAAALTNHYKSGRPDTDVSASDAGIGTSSGNSGYLVEGDGAADSSLVGWGLSCKRKALEGTSGQSFRGGSSSCFPQTDNIVRHTVPVRYNASSSLSISSPVMNPPIINSPEQLNNRLGMRGVASDVFPLANVTENAESSQRHFGMRMNLGHQESVPFNLSSSGNAARRSSICSSHQSSRSISLNDILDSRPTTSVSTNSSNPSIHAHLMHVPSLPRNVLPFPWNGHINSRTGTSSSSVAPSGERGAELNFRSSMRNNVPHPNFVPATEARSLVQDPTIWSLATGSPGTNGGSAPSTSRNASASGSRPFTTVWLPHHNSGAQPQQRLSEFPPWTLFPSAEAETGGQRGHFSPFASGSSSSSEEPLMSSGANSQGHHHPYHRSALLMELPSDDWRALAADIEGRQRLVSEIRQVLNAMRRGENLRAEDYMLFDPFINGVAEMHDRHRDMRLDVDNMSYEELLALEERIGNVNTGLSEEVILKSMKQRKHIMFMAVSPPNLEPCCICQEEYDTGDDIGTLDCGHDFHTYCIKQWLAQKNLCPIYKMTALATT